MNTTSPEIADQPHRLRLSILFATFFAAMLWSIALFEFFTGADFTSLGVLPREPVGLLGILFAPLIHSSWLHLAANTGPAIILGAALLYGYPRAAKIVIPLVYLGTGLVVWLFARPVYHIGASGLTFGVMFFITAIGFLRRDKQALALALTAFFLYGGMMGGFFPEEKNISYETHIAAALIGIVLAFLLKNLDPPPPRKIYSWELEEDEEPDDTYDTTKLYEDSGDYEDYDDDELGIIEDEDGEPNKTLH